MKKALFFLYLISFQTSLLQAQSWKLIGNSGTKPDSNFLGTTDAKPLLFRINNKKSGLIDFDELKANTGFGFKTLFVNTGAANSAFGYRALVSNTTGNFNTAFGSTALDSNTIGSSNTAAGSAALFNNITGNNNTATGHNALFFNKAGSNNTATGYWSLFFNVADSNTATGAFALSSNNTGTNNTAFGFSSLFQNTSGSSNTAFGYKALDSNGTGANNTASGYYSLYSNVNGSFNTATGNSALFSNISGSGNTANGASALYNSIGSNNTAAGYHALFSNTTGSNNTAIGNLSLTTNATGSNNTSIGYNARNSTNNLQNATAVGANAIATASNQIMLGSTSVMSVKAAGSFIIYSDGRFKKNIQENVPGLTFINLLRPVTYHYDIRGLNKLIGADEVTEKGINNPDEEKWIAAKEKKVYTGFVAQEVEKAAGKLGYDFSGIYKPQNSKDAYGLSYADFVVPLVKAVQELSAENDAHKQSNETLQKNITAITQKLAEIDNQLAALKGASTSSNLKATVGASANASVSTYLGQNSANPFRTTAIIPYAVPATAKTAHLVIADTKGSIIKTFTLTGRGRGQLTINADMLVPGNYFYSLVVDGKTIASRQMTVIQ